MHPLYRCIPALLFPFPKAPRDGKRKDPGNEVVVIWRGKGGGAGKVEVKNDRQDPPSVPCSQPLP